MVICDDHAILAQGMVAVLGDESDVEVVGVAGSVVEVLELAERHRPDVVLMDYGLPDGDGVSATRTLKQAHPETKVVMLTSYSNEAVLVGAIEAGCSGFMTKHEGSAVVASGVRLAAAGEALISAPMLRQLLPRLSQTDRRMESRLTGRELEVLGLLADGVPTQKIAERLYLSSNTVRNHSQRILSKLGVHSRLEAVAVALRQGLIPRP